MSSGTARTSFGKRLGRVFSRSIVPIAAIMAVYLAVNYYRAERSALKALRTPLTISNRDAIAERVRDAAQAARLYFAGAMVMLAVLGFAIHRGRRRLESLGDEMEGLVGRVLHDLSRSLSAINVEAVNMMAGEPGARPSAVGRIESISRSESKRIGDYLMLARGFSGFDRASAERVNLSAAACRIAADFKMNERKVEIKCCTPPEDVFIRAHPTLVSEIVGNLIENAVKYTDSGTVTVCVSSRGGFATLAVSDTGRGIPKKQLKHIFGRFCRADNVADIPGTGLGLSMVHELVTRHYDGRIRVESALGKGSTFTVTLPSDVA